jgi:chemotaxis protein CheC
VNLDRFVAINALAAAAASRALARLTRRSADVKLLNAKLVGLAETHRVIDFDEIVVGISMSISGGLQGAALLCFSEPKALALSEILVGTLAGGSARSTDLDESALNELGNIVCGNYVTALANQLNVKVMPGIPHLTRGVFGPMLEQVIAGLAFSPQLVLLIDVELHLPAGVVLGHLLFTFMGESIIDARCDARP